MPNAMGWKAIAKMLDCSIRTVHYYIARHKLPVKRTPTGRPILLETDLKEWLKDRDKTAYLLYLLRLTALIGRRRLT